MWANVEQMIQVQTIQARDVQWLFGRGAAGPDRLQDEIYGHMKDLVDAGNMSDYNVYTTV
jgi:hypothetical protein